MRIDAPLRADVRHVAENMRQKDIVEFRAISRAESTDELAEALVERYGDRGDTICARLDDGTPVAVGAMIESRFNVVTLLFFATDDFPQIAMALTKFIVQRLFPRYRNAGVHRIECVSHVGYTEAHRWIETLGLEKEAEMPGYGRNGETYFQFAWVDDRVRQTGNGA